MRIVIEFTPRACRNIVCGAASALEYGRGRGRCGARRRVRVDVDIEIDASAAIGRPAIAGCKAPEATPEPEWGRRMSGNENLMQRQPRWPAITGPAQEFRGGGADGALAPCLFRTDHSLLAPRAASGNR
jgi:hypothetical protein